MTVVPLAVLLWLGWKLTQQDDAIDAQQRRDRLQLAAERVVSVIERAVSTSEQAVAAGRVEWANGAVAVTFHGDRVDLAPSGRVAYMPVVPPARVVPDAVFRDAEVLEFQRQDRRAAVAAYRRLSLSADAAVRAGALLRLGRNLNALGDTDAALEAYAALTQIDDVLEASVPVSLAAAWGRCVVLEKHRRDVELRAEARNLYEAMRAGRWRPPKPST